MTQFVELLRNQAKWYAQPGHNARDLMDSLMLEKAADEIERLRARIEAMEQQVPICRAEDLRHAEILLPALGLMPEDKLYALPGAKGEEK